MPAEPPQAIESDGPAPMVVPLTRAATLSADQIGGKAANLARLAAAGLPVPAGFVVPADAFAHPGRLTEALPAAAGILGGGRAAVRSSAPAEDLPGASYAGQYDSILGVAPDQLLDAILRVHASAANARVAAYRRGPARLPTDPDAGGAEPRMAVLVQRMVDPTAAGVAFTANPLTGDRAETVITAVAGLGEGLVGGQGGGDEWIVRGDRADRTRRARIERTVDAAQARDIARLARRVERLLGVPQDIEWAIQDGQIWLLQARPMTALPEPADWTPPGPGVWLRNFRLGEWLPDPMTPLFADWLLPAILAGFHRGMLATAGAVLPFRTAAINGWYYTSPNPDPRAILSAVLTTRGRILRFVWAALVAPFRDPAAADRRLLGALAQRWRTELLPRYEDLVATRAPDVATAQPAVLIGTAQEIAEAAGEALWWLAVVGGAAWKMEAALARLLRHRLGRDHPDAPQSMVRLLLAGLPGTEPDLPPHAVHSIDPVHPTAGELGWRPEQAGGGARHRRLAADRKARTAVCMAALAGDRRRQARFAAQLDVAQRYTVLREEQARSLTLGWPLLRACLLRLGQGLTAAGVVDRPDDVFFLTRAELHQRSSLHEEVVARRATWTRRRRLAAPLTIGTPPRPLARVLRGGTGGDTASAVPPGTLVGEPASPGTATGTVRIVNDPAEFGSFQPGEILVARATAPAWTVLFAKAAAVVTDAGTVAAHASLVAREYGIPAVVGTGQATTKLRTGQVVTVDGTAGQVHQRT